MKLTCTRLNNFEDNSDNNIKTINFYTFSSSSKDEMEPHPLDFDKTAKKLYLLLHPPSFSHSGQSQAPH